MATIVRRGDKWQAKVRRQGYASRSATFQTRTAALEWARRVEGEVDTGKAARTRYAASLTLGEAVDRYEREVTAAKRSPGPERRRLAFWRAHRLASRPLDSIRASDLSEVRDELSRAGLGANSVRLTLAPISHLFTVARSDWGLDALENPVRAVRRPSVADTARDRRLRAGELPRLEAACKAGPAWLWPAVEFAIESAMRRSEIAALRWSWIDADRQIATFPRTKTTGAVEIPLVGRSLDVLSRVEYRGDVVFGITADAISRAFWQACKAARIFGLRFHDLRHEATSRLFEAGYSIAEVRVVTRHKSLAMLSRYTNLRAEDVAKKKRPP